MGIPPVGGQTWGKSSEVVESQLRAAGYAHEADAVRKCREEGGIACAPLMTQQEVYDAYQKYQQLLQQQQPSNNTGTAGAVALKPSFAPTPVPTPPRWIPRVIPGGSPTTPPVAPEIAPEVAPEVAPAAGAMAAVAVGAGLALYYAIRSGIQYGHFQETLVDGGKVLLPHEGAPCLRGCHNAEVQQRLERPATTPARTPQFGKPYETPWTAEMKAREKAALTPQQLKTLTNWIGDMPPESGTPAKPAATPTTAPATPAKPVVPVSKDKGSAPAPAKPAAPQPTPAPAPTPQPTPAPPAAPPAANDNSEKVSDDHGADQAARIKDPNTQAAQVTANVVAILLARGVTADAKVVARRVHDEMAPLKDQSGFRRNGNVGAQDIASVQRSVVEHFMLVHEAHQIAHHASTAAEADGAHEERLIERELSHKKNREALRNLSPEKIARLKETLRAQIDAAKTEFVKNEVPQLDPSMKGQPFEALPPWIQTEFENRAREMVRNTVGNITHQPTAH